MTLANRVAERIRRGERLPWWADAPLAAATPILQLGMRRRLRQPAERVCAYVISFGNLTAGGTGKTPAVIERARAEVAEGRRVAILTRGYRAPAGPQPAVSTEIQPGDRYHRLGDEAALILEKVPEVVVVKNRDRNAAARRAVEDFRCNVLILDDGYQYMALAKDENALLIDASSSFGNGSLIPRGNLREPLNAMVRATKIILTRCDQAADVDATVETIRRFAPDTPIRKTVHAPTALRRLTDNRLFPLDFLRNTDVAALCGIGHPEAFYGTIEAMGARVVERITLPDHAQWNPKSVPEYPIVVMTEKDAVRFPNPNENAYALEIALRDV